MSQARDIMNRNPPHCGLDTPVQEVARRFAEEGCTGMLVVDDDERLAGIITETDLVDQQRNLHLPTAIAIFDMVIPLGEARFEKELEHMQALTAGDLMSTAVKTVAPDAGLAEIATLMGEDDVHHLPVIDGDAIVGSISKHDFIRALASRLS